MVHDHRLGCLLGSLIHYGYPDSPPMPLPTHFNVVNVHAVWHIIANCALVLHVHAFLIYVDGSVAYTILLVTLFLLSVFLRAAWKSLLGVCPQWSVHHYSRKAHPGHLQLLNNPNILTMTFLTHVPSSGICVRVAWAPEFPDGDFLRFILKVHEPF